MTTLHSIITYSRKNYQTLFIVIASLWMLLHAVKVSLLSCGCEEIEKPGIELNVGLKDFFFKYPNL